MPRVLLVEDESAIAETVLYPLRAEGFDALDCLTGGEAIRAAREARFDLAILDVGLPDIGGFALCRQLRRARDLPVIFLTAQSAEADRILGLELGADDHVSKPFSPRELVARVRAVLRRSTVAAVAWATSPAFEHDAEGKRIRLRGALLDLRRYEYGLLAALLQRPGAVLSRGRIRASVAVSCRGPRISAITASPRSGTSRPWPRGRRRSSSPASNCRPCLGSNAAMSRPCWRTASIRSDCRWWTR